MRTADRTILRDAATIAAAAALIGVSFGVLARGKGVTFEQTQVMSLGVFAGGSQFVLVGGVGSGLAAACVAGLVLNARHIPFGLSVAPVLDGPLWRRLVASQLVVDESTAYALSEDEPWRKRQGFWAVGLMLFVAWNAGTAIGALAGEAIDYRALGVDAAFPALLLAVLAPQLGTRPGRIAAVSGGAIAIVTIPLVPRGVPILLAGAGAAIAYVAGGEEAGA